MQYNREAARNYAKIWAYRRNPVYFDFSQIGGDCTNFASQCLFAGSGVMNYTPTFGWFFNSVNDRAPAWTGVEELYRFLTTNRGPGPQAVTAPLTEAQPGDIIQLRFTGTGRFDHSPVVVEEGTSADTIYVAAHSRDCDCRPVSTYSYNAIRLLHIVNVGEG